MGGGADTGGGRGTEQKGDRVKALGWRQAGAGRGVGATLPERSSTRRSPLWFSALLPDWTVSSARTSVRGRGHCWSPNSVQSFSLTIFN